MLALAAAQPQSFTPAELEFLLAYLHEFAGQIEFAESLPVDNQTETWYWINDTRDQPPCAVVRRPPLANGQNVFLPIELTFSNYLPAGDAIIQYGSPS